MKWVPSSTPSSLRPVHLGRKVAAILFRHTRWQPLTTEMPLATASRGEQRDAEERKGLNGGFRDSRKGLGRLQGVVYGGIPQSFRV